MTSPSKSRGAQLGLEAGEWLLELEERDPDAERMYPDAAQRQEAFFAWVSRSPEHARVFLETAETWRRLARLDSQRLIEIRELLENRTAKIIQLYGAGETAASPSQVQPGNAVRYSEPPLRRSITGFAVAAGVAAVIGIGIAVSVNVLGPETYRTYVGQHGTHVLADGSIVYLNTDSRVRIDYSNTQRHIDLVKGEALFVVAADSGRPFTVNAGGAVIRALGTQFNVREGARGTEVTVVEGAVQVASVDNGVAGNRAPQVPAAASAAVPLRLNAGEEAKVIGGTVRKSATASVSDAISWREWRLVFRNAPLTEIADEFNRYNRNQIRIEGAQARTKQMTGVFDADRPESLIAYTSKDETLSVRAEGDDWVISAR